MAESVILYRLEVRDYWLVLQYFRCLTRSRCLDSRSSIGHCQLHPTIKSKNEPELIFMQIIYLHHGFRNFLI